MFDKSITLCAIDCLTPELAANVLKKTGSFLNFDRILLISDTSVKGDHDYINIDKLTSVEAYNAFILEELANHIDTDFVLVVQWDGYVVHPESWSNLFFDYDYIGAIWPHYNDDYVVGNGGFSLRSKELLLATSELFRQQTLTGPEDEIICRTFRRQLENNYKIKYAPIDIATRFSHENSEPDFPTFGFHGFWNIWRYINDEQALKIIRSLPDVYFKQIILAKTLMSYYHKRNYEITNFIYAKIVKQIGHETLEKTLIYALNYKYEDIKSFLDVSRQLYIRQKLFNAGFD